MPKRQCEYNGCHRHAAYFMNWVEDGQKRSGYVCATHDQHQGRGNLAEALDISMAEAVRLDIEMGKEADSG